MKEKYLNVGKIVNTHGLKGEVKVYSLTDNVERFNDLHKVYIDGNEVTILGCKFQKDRVILKIEGIDTIEEATKYKNKFIKVPRENAIKLPEGRYFISDIIGCNVFDENELYLGKVVDVIQTKNNDVYWVKGEKELMIPVLKSIVVEININKEKIIIKPVKQWLEE
ncbi:ribosome maturation factor RimM [Clostridium rectalis]|uniref:ribosome maturation factor RimM n=1 Tax=Clostridium rectalis TaxID=2040295 RepID=UPI000F6355A0|nr:ribosome maturation factor RimM [Clostridium rectalis]